MLTDRSTLSKGKDLGVFSTRTWRLATLAPNTHFLRAGLGWGGMPAELVESDLARGAREDRGQDAPKGFIVAMSAVYRTEAPPGIAARWLIDRLKKRSESGANGPARNRRQNKV